MSKVVKKVGRAVKKVVKGVAKVAKGVIKSSGMLLRKLSKSKIGRVLITAGLIYFGGAAIAGAFSGGAAASAAGGSWLSGAVSGAGTGIANAWSGLTSAASSFMSGNFSQGASALGQGAMGQPVSAVGSQITNAKGLIASQVGEGAIGSAVATPVTGGAAIGTPLPAAGAAGAAAPAASSQGASWIGKVWDGLGQYGKMAAVQGGMQLAGGLVQGIGAQKQQEEQWNREDTLVEQERQRRENNMSGQFRFGEATDSPYVDQYRQDPNQFTGPPGDNMAGGPRYLQGGLIGGSVPGFRSSLERFPLYTPRRFA